MNGSQFKYASKLYKLNQLLITAKLQKALQNGTYHPKGSMKFRYRERGKERLISSIVTPDKAVNHVICDEVLTPYLQKFLQYDNSASQKGKGVAFHRRRFENDLRNYYREEGTNEGYVLFIDFSGYYANIQHEPCKAVLHELLEKSGLSDELRLITEDLMDEIFKTFEMDVSRFSDEDIEAMMNGKVDPFMNMGVPKELLAGEKMLAKGADIGNQLAQNIGITFPYRIDNYCKIVCGMKHQGRYSDDMHIIHRSKEVLLKVLEGVKTIAAEYGLILNEKKTHICKLSGEYRYLQVKYTLLQNGIVVRRIHPKAITRERRKLKAYKRLLDKGIVTMEEIDGYFRSWLSGNYKYMSRDQIYKMNSLYVKLFGRSVRKYQLFIQRVVVIPHLTLTILVPVVNHARFSVPHVEHPVIIQMLLVFVRVNIQLMVNQLKCILFVNAPQSSLFQPDSVEIRTPNHQVLGLFDDEFGIDFDYTAFSRARCNH